MISSTRCHSRFARELLLFRFPLHGFGACTGTGTGMEEVVASYGKSFNYLESHPSLEMSCSRFLKESELLA